MLLSIKSVCVNSCHEVHLKGKTKKYLCQEAVDRRFCFGIKTFFSVKNWYFG